MRTSSWLLRLFTSRAAAGVLSLVTICSVRAVRADEGMWPMNNVPADRIAEKYGFKPDQAWLQNVQLSSARLAQGCSASFVSAHGLVMTNHHCAHECIEQLSQKGQDLVANGFYAPNEPAEKRCPALEVNQLVSITDVTESVRSALAEGENVRRRAASRAALCSNAGSLASIASSMRR